MCEIGEGREGMNRILRSVKEERKGSERLKRRRGRDRRAREKISGSVAYSMPHRPGRASDKNMQEKRGKAWRISIQLTPRRPPVVGGAPYDADKPPAAPPPPENADLDTLWKPPPAARHSPGVSELLKWDDSLSQRSGNWEGVGRRKKNHLQGACVEGLVSECLG